MVSTKGHLRWPIIDRKGDAVEQERLLTNRENLYSQKKGLNKKKLIAFWCRELVIYNWQKNYDFAEFVAEIVIYFVVRQIEI